MSKSDNSQTKMMATAMVATLFVAGGLSQGLTAFANDFVVKDDPAPLANFDDEANDSTTGDESVGPEFLGDYQSYRLAYLDAKEQERLRLEEENRIRAELEAKEREAAEAAAKAEQEAAEKAERERIAAEEEKARLANAIGNTSYAEQDTNYVPSANLPADYQTLQWTAFLGKTTWEKVELIGALARQDMHESGILASVTAAQAIIESGWMESKLAQYNALFGIKTCPLEKNWKDSPWDGSAKDFKTGEEYTPGVHTTITAAFRTYPTIWASIKDHSAYLINSKKDGQPRYPGIVGMKDPKAVATLIKNGEYATSSSYIEEIVKCVEKYNLTKFDQ